MCFRSFFRIFNNDLALMFVDSVSIIFKNFTCNTILYAVQKLGGCFDQCVWSHNTTITSRGIGYMTMSNISTPPLHFITAVEYSAVYVISSVM